MKTIYKILFLLIAAPVVFLLAKPLKSIKWFRYIFISCHAIFLTYLTIFLFNQPSWRWAEQRSVLSKLSSSENIKGYEFVRNNFLLIDNSFDKVLEPNPEGDESDSTSIVLTNRKSLTSFLKIVNQEIEKIDFVVIDIGFAHQTDDDSSLKEEVLQLYSQNKLLLSIDPSNAASVQMINNPGVYGNINENNKENLFTTHAILNNGYYSLPYKMYCMMNNKSSKAPFFYNKMFREKDSSNNSGIALNTFFPDFKITNESILRGENSTPQNSLLPDIENGAETGSRTCFFLSQPLSAEGRLEFINNLQQRKNNGKRNIVFIGAFGRTDEDVHQTLYGELHGATIIMNILYSLHERGHILKFSYVFFLLAGYFILSMILFYKGLGIHFSVPRQIRQVATFFTFKSSKRAKKKPGKSGDTITKWFKSLAHFIFTFVFVTELPITLLLVFSVIVQLFFGEWPNILPLLIYFAGIEVSLEYAKEHLT